MQNLQFQDTFNKGNLIDVSGRCFLYKEYPTDGSITFPNGDGTNEDVILDGMSAFTPEDIGWFTDGEIIHGVENEKVKESDACGNEEIDNSADLITTATFTIQEIGNIDLFAKLIGQSVQTRVGGPVVGRVVTVGPFSAYLDSQVFGSSKVYDTGTFVVTGVSGSTDGSLTLTTDYLIVTDANGDETIELVSGGAITTLDQIISVTFSATEKPKKIISYKNGTRSMPYLAIRFCECDKTSQKIVRNHYIIKARVSSETVMQFINESRSDFTGATITFTTAKDGNYAQAKVDLP